MKRGILFILVFWAVLTLATESLVLVGPIEHSDIPRLSREYPLIVDDYRDGYAYCYSDADDLHLLAGLPWPHRVLIHDLQAYYAAERALWPPDDRDEPWDAPWDAFHSYAETIALLQQWSEDYPDICRLVDVGDSVQDRELLVLVVSANVDEEEYEPEVRILGTFHGNEIVTNEIVLYCIERLLIGYGDDPEITGLVDDFELWLQPLVNPDGYVNGTRRNAHSVDLNRNLSYMWESGGGHGPYPFSEPETQAVADYSGGHEDHVPDAVEDNTFVLGLTYHSGAICVNYVWNYQQERAPDDAHVQTICYDYSDSCELSPYYPPWVDGHGYRDDDYMDWVTNGWDWYEIHGDLNDWSYGVRGCIDTTIEADDEKHTDPRDIISQADVNWYAIKSWIEWADDGLHGIVTGPGDEPIPAAITVGDRDEAFMYNDPTVLGDYWLPLADGFYDITFSAEGYDPIVFEDVEITGEDTPPLDVQFGDSDTPDLCKLTALRTSDGVLVSWRSNGGFSSFNVYRVDAAGSILQRINENRLPGAAVSLLDLAPPSPVARYRLEAVTPAGHRMLFGPVEVEVGETFGGTAILGVFPNPVGDRAAVELSSAGGYLEVSLYDLAGRLISVLYRGVLPPGRNTLGLDAAGLKAGVYMLVVQAGGGISIQRFVVVR
ncbi:T9SS type A sorting domain-containing protein [bacterium]|nr:T9SS type A sorting domain-containing protein [bacterium]